MDPDGEVGRPRACRSTHTPGKVAVTEIATPSRTNSLVVASVLVTMNRLPLLLRSTMLPLFITVVALSVGYLVGSLRRSKTWISDATRGSSADAVFQVGRAASASTAGPPASVGCGLVFFYHVNKVGGGTVQDHLRESTHEYLQLFPDEKDWTRALPEIEAFLRFDGDDGTRWKALEIHHGFPGLLYLQEELAAWEATVLAQGCAFRKVTLLRNPVERLVSNMKWNHVSLDAVQFAKNTANWMSRFLAFNNCNEERVCRFKRKTGDSNSPAMSDQAFQSLIEMLDGFDAVGVMEDLQAFMDHVLGRRVSLVSTHRQNYSKEPYPLTAAMYQDLLRLNPYDFRLYWRYAPAVLPVPTERAEDMTLDKMRRYYLLNKPVLVKGAAPLLFRNHGDFSSDYVRRNVDPAMVVRASHHTGRLLNGDINTTVPECLDAPGRCVYFKKSTFSYEGDEAIATDDTDALSTGLLAGLNRSTFAWNGANEGCYTIYVAAHGGALPHSHSQRFNLLTEGRKRWVIVNPTAYANKSQREGFELKEDTGLGRNRKKGDVKGDYQWEGTDYQPQEWFQDVISQGVDIPHYDFVQEAGDLFFLPHKFTHGTMDLTPHTIGIIFKGGMAQVGMEALKTKSQEGAAHLPWRPVGTPSLADRGHRLPSPLGRGRPDGDGNGWQRVAGGTARRFRNERLDHHVS